LLQSLKKGLDEGFDLFCPVSKALFERDRIMNFMPEEKIKSFLHDNRKACIYENDAAIEKTIAEISEEALAKI
jgi:hypothetical protein